MTSPSSATSGSSPPGFPYVATTYHGLDSCTRCSAGRPVGRLARYRVEHDLPEAVEPRRAGAGLVELLCVSCFQAGWGNPFCRRLP